MNTLDIKPFLKWVGGKRQLINEIEDKLSMINFNDYYEPFVGGGALFMHLQNKNTIINDYSKELVDAYLTIKNQPEKLMKKLDEHIKNHRKNPEEYYYYMRNMDRESNWNRKTKLTKTARLMYLNKTCFNGLYRVNSNGYFNVPFNGKTDVNLYDRDNVLNLSKFLGNGNVQIYNGDFEKACKNAKAGDLIFFDPPYDLLKADTFEAYTKDGFGVEGQKRLSNLAHQLKAKGCYVMLTNHNTELINNLYRDEFKIHPVNVKRLINSNASNRTGVETIIYSW